MIKHYSIAILGFGREGEAVLRYIKTSRCYPGSSITVLDHDEHLKIPRGARAILGPRYLQHLKNFDLIFRSPGIPYNTKEIRDAIRSGVQFSSATKLFFEHAKGTIIGITGTKGKGTTSTLLYQLLKTAKKDVHLAGNIGVPAITLCQKLKKSSIAVLELSSFQLQDLACSPHVSITLDIFPDHMDAHRDFEEYIAAKSSIAKFQKTNDVIFYASDNPHAAYIALQGIGKKICVSPHDFNLFLPQDVRIPGVHNFKNAVMAATVARYFGVPDKKIIAITKKFRGLPHRLEIVRDGAIRFINDSAGTNPHTTAAAVRAFSGPLVVIAGGKDKGTPFEPFAKSVVTSPNVKYIILFGENKKKIRDALSDVECQISDVADTLREATLIAYKQAKLLAAHSATPITILFSPGSASFDLFTDYKDRGEQFKKIVSRLR